jgi:hypothetical protein
MVVITQGARLVDVQSTDVHTPYLARFELAPGNYTLSIDTVRALSHHRSPATSR